MSDILYILYPIITYILTPVLSMLSCLYILQRFKFSKREKIILIVAGLISSVIILPLSQIYVPLGAVGGFAVLFAIAWKTTRIDAGKALLLTLLYIIVSYLLWMTLVFIFGGTLMLFYPTTSGFMLS